MLNTRLVAFTLALVVGFCAYAEDIRITLEGDVSRTPIAVPDFATEPGLEALGRELAEVIRYDLEFTGLVRLIPPAKYPAEFDGFSQDARSIDFEAWRETDAEYVAHVYVQERDGSIIANCQLFDLTTGLRFFGKRYSAPSQWKRFLAHYFSDDIVSNLSGEPGAATSQICFSGGTTDGKEIFLVDYDGANLKQATRHGSISILPRFSPDGRKIAYVSYKDRYPFLYVLDLETGVSRPLSKDVGVNITPAWAPDGSRLAITLSRDANNEIYLVNADGSGKTRLTNNKAVDTSPAFSPSGNTIAFVSDRGGAAQIFAMDPDGSDVRRLSFQGGRAYSPVYSPNGDYIAYVVEKSGEGYQIYVMNADGSNARRLTTAGANEAPSWSPDSRHIVFASTRAGGSRLWTVNVQTGQERPVPGLSMASQGPSWGPRRSPAN